MVSIPLPRATPAEVGDASIVSATRSTDAPQSLKILLAEDHPTNQRVVQLILASQGAELVTVEDGRQAVEAF
ncbi:hypothetical protein ACETUS_31420, partial [Priestia megaterium]